MTFDSLSPGQMGFSSCRKSVSVGKSEAKRSFMGFEDAMDLFVKLRGIHASQNKSRVARSVDTVDFEDTFRLNVEGFKASGDLHSYRVRFMSYRACVWELTAELLQVQ